MALSVTASKTIHRSGSTIDSIHFVQGEVVLPSFTIAGAVGAVTWSDGGAGGTFSGVPTDLTRNYTPKNKTQIITLTFNDGATTVNKTLVNTATMPLYPQAGFSLALDDKTDVKTAQDGTKYLRSVQNIDIAWQLDFERREKTEIFELWRFWIDHRKTSEFWVVDTAINLINKVRAVSGIEPKYISGNSYSVSLSVTGIYAGIVFDSGCPHI